MGQSGAFEMSDAGSSMMIVEWDRIVMNILNWISFVVLLTNLYLTAHGWFRRRNHRYYWEVI
jgi:hypothetical protein